MTFTDTSQQTGPGDRRQPIDSSCLGLRAPADISVRQYPKTENAVVTVLTAYYDRSLEERSQAEGATVFAYYVADTGR